MGWEGLEGGGRKKLGRRGESSITRVKWSRTERWWWLVLGGGIRNSSVDLVSESYSSLVESFVLYMIINSSNHLHQLYLS